MSDVSASVTVAAAADLVYDLASDLPRMGEWSPEAQGGRWLGGASAAGVGVRFRGNNRNGWRRWSTTVTVTEAERGRRFRFAVSYGPVPVAEWSYELEPTAEGGCRVTESWTDRRPRPLRVLGGPATGVADRVGFTRRSIEQTLQRLKATAESGPT
jgi:hypothetical protein